jgi:hypothetical protein
LRVESTRTIAPARTLVLATFGQMSPAAIRDDVADPALTAQLRPLQLASLETNWTRSGSLILPLASEAQPSAPLKPGCR